MNRVSASLVPRSNFFMTSIRIGIIGREGKPSIQDSLDRIYNFLVSESVEIRVERDTADLMSQNQITTVTRDELTTCTYLVVVGGDGSILGVARDFAANKIPIIGVNRGGLGFLADVSPDDIEQGMANVLQGEYRQEEHFLLNLTVIRDGEVIAESPALNDVVVSSGSLSKMMDFSLYIDDQFVYSQYSDGLIVATPTGSTAYSLSAGGPILHPSLDAVAIVPMFPHTLTSRPIMVQGSSKIKVVPGVVTTNPQVSADSQVQFDILPGDEVTIEKYKDVIHLIHPTTHSFYEACRSKLDWGSRLGRTTRTE